MNVNVSCNTCRYGRKPIYARFRNDQGTRIYLVVVRSHSNAAQ